MEQQSPRTDDDDDDNKLEFFEAMRDFRKMFPRIEDDVIEAVLRSNNGAVDDTIDQLLVISLEKEENVHAETVPKRIGDLETAIPRVDMTMVDLPAIGAASRPWLSRDQATNSAAAAAAASATTAAADRRNLIDMGADDDKAPPPDWFGGLTNTASAAQASSTSSLPSTSATRTSGARSPHRPPKKKIYRPPLVGELPPDFLRISSSDDPWAVEGPRTTPRGSPSSSARVAYSKRRSTVDYHNDDKSGGGDDESYFRPDDGPPPSYAVAVGRRNSDRVTSTNTPRRHVTAQHTSAYLGVFRTTSTTMRPSTTPSRRSAGHLAPTAESLKEAWEENEWKRSTASDPELAQYLEDERVAIMLQNEEFMRHLRNDRDFLAVLERDAAEARKRQSSPRKSSSSRPKMPPASQQNSMLTDPGTSSSAVPETYDDAGGLVGPFPADPFPYTKTLQPSEDTLDRGFQEKLALMGRASKRKFATMARRFISKKRGAKGVLDNSDERTHALLLDSDDEADGIIRAGGDQRDGGYNQPTDADYNIGRNSDLKQGRFF